VPSDRVIRLSFVQSDRSGARLSGRSACSDGVQRESRGQVDFPFGMPAAAHEPVLRLDSGERVLDECDVPALLALVELSVLIERKWVEHAAAGELPSTAVTRHREETGHRLSFGCCRPQAASDALDGSPSAQTTGKPVVAA